MAGWGGKGETHYFNSTRNLSTAQAKVYAEETKVVCGKAEPSNAMSLVLANDDVDDNVDHENGIPERAFYFCVPDKGGSELPN